MSLSKCNEIVIIVDLYVDGMKVEGVVHFLGGAFVGAAPHLTYRYLLESLSKQGYLIVTTPYRLEFDYIAMM